MTGSSSYCETLARVIGARCFETATTTMEIMLLAKIPRRNGKTGGGWIGRLIHSILTDVTRCRERKQRERKRDGASLFCRHLGVAHYRFPRCRGFRRDKYRVWHALPVARFINDERSSFFFLSLSLSLSLLCMDWRCSVDSVSSLSCKGVETRRSVERGYLVVEITS